MQTAHLKQIFQTFPPDQLRQVWSGIEAVQRALVKEGLDESGTLAILILEYCQAARAEKVVTDQGERIRNLTAALDDANRERMAERAA